ncbi:MAG: hypothetical protein LQ349_008701 [Xanthoria aureola]|nr:MAG: hypothetical protein LQ349_008701 [Xanthoria aureola]
MAGYNDWDQSDIYKGTIFQIVLATVSVAVRLVARQKSPAKLWWDDFTVVVALIRYCGLGRHTNTADGRVGPDQLPKFFKLFLAIQIMYFTSAVFLKTSLILLYYRIFGVVRWFRWLLAVVWVAILLYFVISSFVTVFNCRPIAFYWDKSITNGACIEENPLLQVKWIGVANLIIDFAVWSLSLPMVWRLHLSWRQKLSLSFVFLIGLLACTASVVRVVVLSRTKPEDITHGLGASSIWTTGEQSVGITCACLPTIRPLIARIWKGAQKRKEGGPSERQMTPSLVPLTHNAARLGVHDTTDTTTDDFVRLTEGNAPGYSLVTAHASEAKGR